jgi:very-short-patch-repair endonuclease
MPGLQNPRFRAQLNAPERLLWSRLRLFRGSGFHFRKQAQFQAYVLDFVCHSRRVVVEVDGSKHAEERHAQHDLVRDAILRRQGYEVLRVPASDVMRNLDGVMAHVEEALHLQALRARVEAEEP